MAYTKKTNTTETVKNESVKEEKKVLENKSKVTSVVKEYNGDDLIPCRSMTKGELICVGKKSKETYMWADYGDITEVEYQDLLALKASKSSFIFDTLFIIDETDLPTMGFTATSHFIKVAIISPYSKNPIKSQFTRYSLAISLNLSASTPSPIILKTILSIPCLFKISIALITAVIS